MTPEQVLQRPAEEVYMILLYDFEQAEYQKRLRQVQEENRKLQELVSKK